MDNSFIKWSQREYKDLPWRKNRSLYGTLVSEIMLQQTTVGTVLKHFDRFLKVFPDIQTLAQATEEEVCARWQGLGYYRRARNLRKAAVAIVEDHGGVFPKTKEELKKIPGVGDYTAGALIAIGMNNKAVAVDANLERVIARFFALKSEKGLKLQKEIQKLFENGELEELYKYGKPRAVTEALMDIGRVFCQAKRADCLICPLASGCQANKKKVSPLTFPIVKEANTKEAKNLELDLLRVVVKKRGQVLGQIKNQDEWLSGQIEVPTFILRSQDRALKQYPRLAAKFKKKIEKLEELPIVKTAITKYKIKNYILVLDDSEFQGLIAGVQGLPNYKYFKFDIQTNHFSTTTIKSFRKLGYEV